MGTVQTLTMEDRASVAVARQWVRQVSAEVGLPPVDGERMAIAVSELAQNQLDHAKRGTVTVRAVRRGDVLGIEIEAVDRGPGLVDPGGVVAGRLPGMGLGAGVAAVRRMTEELELDVRIGEGVAVRARRFAAPAPRHPDVAVLGRALEDPSGDGAWIGHDREGVLIVVVDGVGHGDPAHEACSRAIAAAADLAIRGDPLAVLAAMSRALRSTRGAAATVARIDTSPRRLRVAGIGNVRCRVLPGSGPPHHAEPTAGVLGAGPVHARQHELPWGDRATLVLFTDGVSSRVAVARPAERSVFELASELMGVARATDDALVLVAR